MWQNIDIQTHFNWPEGEHISYSIQICHALKSVYCFCSFAILLHDGTPKTSTEFFVLSHMFGRTVILFAYKASWILIEMEIQKTYFLS